MLAAAELGVFDALAKGDSTVAATAQALKCDVRGLTTLLDAVTALGLLTKTGEKYALAPGVADTLTAEGAHTVLAMARHQANCLRNWAQLAMVDKTGRPAPDIPSVRGETGDQEAFIGAMHNVSAPNADGVVRALDPLRFDHVLDIGGGSGTWTLAWLSACPGARATLFDLPHVIAMARRRFAAAGVLDRVALVAGDFYQDSLPPGADLAWLSAIVHQNSRAQNRALFGKVYAALSPGGRIAIRDILMEPDRTRPVAGALFAINMLVATPGGGTFTFDELKQDLESAGFTGARVEREDQAMNALTVAEKAR